MHPHALHSCGKWGKTLGRVPPFHGFCRPHSLWTTERQIGPAILARGRLSSARPFFRASFWGRDEADLPAERTQAEAEAWLSRPHGDACRTADSEAAPREGPQAPVGVVPPVQRRNRLSRSRDFDAVYRQGRSVSTRFLTLYWFARDEAIGAPRLGFAVPKAVGNAVVRNRIKRQLRDIVRGRLETVPVTNDYVLVVRQGLPEAAEANGHVWLEERVDEVLGKAAA
jgi:ribonuclease P protein component